MSWWALALLWAGMIIGCYGCYRLGITVGHIEGHQCEIIGRSIHQLEREANEND